MYRIEANNGSYDLYRVNSKGHEQHVKHVPTELEALQAGFDLANYDLQIAISDYKELEKKLAE